MMPPSIVLARQRALLDRLLTAGLLPIARYLRARTQVADVRVPPRCAHHPRVVALIYGPDNQTPLCGPCGLAAYTPTQED